MVCCDCQCWCNACVNSFTHPQRIINLFCLFAVKTSVTTILIISRKTNRNAWNVDDRCNFFSKTLAKTLWHRKTYVCLKNFIEPLQHEFTIIITANVQSNKGWTVCFPRRYYDRQHVSVLQPATCRYSDWQLFPGKVLRKTAWCTWQEDQPFLCEQ